MEGRFPDSVGGGAKRVKEVSMLKLWDSNSWKEDVPIR